MLSNKFLSVSGASEPTDAQFNYVTMLLHGDGTNGAQNNTFLDSSTNNFTITRNGNTTQGTFSPYGTLWSNYNTSGSTTCAGIYLNGESDFAFSSGDFTIEMWVNLYSKASGGQVIYDSRPASTEGFYPTVYVDSATNKLIYYTNSANRITQTSTFTYNVWHHVVVTRTGINTKMFVDGVQEGSTYTDSNTYINGTSRPFTGDGPNPSVSSYGVTGYISNLRVVKGSGPYQSAGSTITVPTSPLTAVTNTVLLTAQSNRFIDTNTQTTVKTINLYNGPAIQRFSPFNPTSSYSTSVIGGSGYFDGTGDYLSAPNNAVFSLSGDFTIECWWYPTDLSASTNLWCLGNSASAQNGLTVYWSSASSALRVWSNGATLFTGSISTPVNAWYHIALVRSGTSLVLYVNGVSAGSVTNSTSFVSVAGNGFCIDAEYAGSYSAGKACYISDVRVTKSAALYTTTFTPPTIPLTTTVSSGTVSLLTSMTNSGIVDNAMMNDLETVGNAQISTSVVKYGTGSLAFDGTGDYLSAPLSQNFYFTGDFTVEAWINVNRTAGALALICGVWYEGPGQAWILYIDSTGKLTFLINTPAPANVTVVSSSSTITNNTWTHVAVTRSGSNWYGFINGTLVSTGTNSSAIAFGSYPFLVGNYTGNPNAGNYFNGYIDDLRITKGYARYTTTFTPPTSALADKGT